MQSEIPTDAQSAFAWHERAGAFERLTPPWEPAELVSRQGSIRDGDRTVIGLRMGPLRRKWIAEHEGYVPGVKFEDRQLSGPFASWHHRHEFQPTESGFRMIDDVRYRLPLSPIGDWVAGGFTQRKLESMFRYRHETLADDLQRHRRWADRPRLTVAVSGAGGLIGRTLCAILSTGGHRVIRLVRRPTDGPDEVTWDVRKGLERPERLLGVDAVVHLAAAGIPDRRWSSRRMAEIRESRVIGTRVLVESIPGGEGAPKIFVSASGIGWYGVGSEGELHEDAPAGAGFLADVAREWEASSNRAAGRGLRTVCLRIGNVLTPRGGMLPPFSRLASVGLRTVLGSGRQSVSWISIDDVGWIVHRALMDHRFQGAINVTSPRPVTQRDFADAVGAARGPSLAVRVPEWAVRTLVGRMADETVLAGHRAMPGRLQEWGYEFRDPELIPALRRLLGRK